MTNNSRDKLIKEVEGGFLVEFQLRRWRLSYGVQPEGWLSCPDMAEGVARIGRSGSEADEECRRRDRNKRTGFPHKQYFFYFGLAVELGTDGHTPQTHPI